MFLYTNLKGLRTLNEQDNTRIYERIDLQEAFPYQQATCYPVRPILSLFFGALIFFWGKIMMTYDRVFGIWVVSSWGSIDAYRSPQERKGWFYQVHPDDFDLHDHPDWFNPEDLYSWHKHLQGKTWGTPTVMADFDKALAYAKSIVKEKKLKR